MNQTSRRHRAGKGLTVTVVAAAVLALAAGCVFAASRAVQGSSSWPYAGIGDSPVIAAVGDIACQPPPKVETEKAGDLCGPGAREAQAATADQIESEHPDLVALLGDEQYQVGRYQDFLGSFDKTYGAFKFLQRPAPGNHEFYPGHGETGDNGIGYFDYYNGIQLNPDTGAQETETLPITTGGTGTFTQPVPRPDGQAGEVGSDWYSYNLGDWHIISLNAECLDASDNCPANENWLQAETQWLASDLSTDDSQCTLAYWHQPAFSPTEEFSADGAATTAWWKLLYQHGADIVLNGHDHVYARYAPMDPNGTADPQNGIREFVVGTGGESLDTLPATAADNVQASTDKYYGTITLRLNPNSYDWDYESALAAPDAPAATYSDTGSGQCHGPANGNNNSQGQNTNQGQNN
jgi:hypothetical protein